jgi:Xaa-Pro dipeptidase
VPRVIAGKVIGMGSALKGETDAHFWRLEKVRKAVAENNMEGIILVPGPNLRYLTGINSLLLERPFLFFLPKDGNVHLVAPALESGPYVRNPLKIVVHSWDDSQGPSHSLQRLARELRLNGKWGLEGRVPFRFIHQLLKYAHPEFDDADGILQSIREIKEPREVKCLRRAASILSKSFQRIPDMLEDGITELELARKISQTVYSNGAELVEDVLVQSGKFASDPHHLPSTKRLKRNESIVVDASCTYSGYYADITRTFIIGENTKFENLYENVLASQEAAIKLSNGGATVGSIDNASRSYLKRSDLDKYFIHRTGHGLGLEVHEAPYIVSGGKEIVLASMVFTIEPGVYVPDKMGVRIEDDVLATDRACKVLTGFLPKEFGWWK